MTFASLEEKFYKANCNLVGLSVDGLYSHIAWLRTIKENRGYPLSNSKKKFGSMEPYKPDFIVANCLVCTYFLDRWQYVIAEMEGKTYGEKGFGIPVLTYEEMAGLVLGFDPWKMGMQLHQVSVDPLLEKLGYQFDPSAKFKGAKGEDIGKPESPGILEA